MKAYRQGNDIAVTWPFKDKITGEPFDFSGLEVAVTAQIGNCRPMKMDITITGNVITFTHAGKDQPSVGVVTLTLFCNKNVSGMVTLDTKDGYEIVAHSWEAEGYDEGEISTDGVYLESTIDAGIRGADAGFGTVDAEVDETTGTPSVEVTTSGPNTAKNIRFHFSGLKGERGADGSDADVTRENIESALNGTPGKNLSTEDFTASDKSKLEGIEAGAQKNVKSDWNAASGDAEILNKPDLSQYITKSVDDLVNYYLKSDTYTKAEVQALIGAIQQFHYEVYPTLADVASPASNVLYLIGPTGTGTDKYKEYVYDSTKQEPWILIGDTSIDLSGYVTTQALNSALADYTTTADLTTLLAGKQDTISDLADIRSGAAAGATAYQKPSGGIPASDMASGVQTSLGKADTAEQTSNKTTTLSASSTDTQYPSAKAVYDALYENVLISLGVNSAGSASDLIGLKVTVTNADTFEQISEQTWNGTPLVVRIKAGVRYTVSTQTHPDYITPASQTFTSEIASTRSVGFIYVYSAVIDLSYRDTDGTKKMVQDTANSYVARVAGDYKLPAVYGNAIKNGSANAAAYTRQGSTYTADFVNYKGAQITSPYIETDTGETIASAALLWQTGTNLISNVAFSNGYVTFTVNSIPSENGLAVLAVKDGNGDIMWSWTIWLTTDTLTAEKFTNYTEVDYYLMPENLFCIWDEQRTSYGTAMIQWGRKDAFVPNIPGSTQMTVYDIEGNAITAGTALGSVIGVFGSDNDQSADKTVANAIKNPGMFFTRYDSTNNNWNNLAWFNNFWNAAETSSSSMADNQDTAVKTIYDPCPFGWMLPAGRAFTGFTTTGGSASTAEQFNVVGSWNAGWNFKRNAVDTEGNRFTASGCRAFGSGALAYVGSYGYAWSFAPGSQALAWFLYFRSDLVRPSDSYGRAFGFAVRPSQEPA